MDERSVLETIEDSFLNLVDSTVEFLPKIIVAGLLLLVGVIVARVVSKWIGKLIDYIENSAPAMAMMSTIGVKKVDIDGIVALFVRWSIILIFLSAAVDVLSLNALTETFDALIDFVPNILAAVAVAALTLFASNAIYDIVFTSAKEARIAAHKMLANVSKVVVLIFGLPLAVAQLGLDLTIITNNLTVIVAGFMLAFGLAFGLGGKSTAGKIVEDLHKNWKK